MKITQERLREMGLEVRVFHFRHETGNGGLEARGGRTDVTFHCNGNVGPCHGFAVCSERDPYDRKKGFQIAAKRAFADYLHVKSTGMPKDEAREMRRQMWQQALGIEEGALA